MKKLLIVSWYLIGRIRFAFIDLDKQWKRIAEEDVRRRYRDFKMFEEFFRAYLNEQDPLNKQVLLERSLPFVRTVEQSLFVARRAKNEVLIAAALKRAITLARHEGEFNDIWMIGLRRLGYYSTLFQQIQRQSVERQKKVLPSKGW